MAPFCSPFLGSITVKQEGILGHSAGNVTDALVMVIMIKLIATEIILWVFVCRWKCQVQMWQAELIRPGWGPVWNLPVCSTFPGGHASRVLIVGDMATGPTLPDTYVLIM